VKKVISLSLVVLFIPVILYSQDKVEAPARNVGDKWTDKDVTGSTFTNEVVRIEEDLFILKTTGVQYLSGYDKKP